VTPVTRFAATLLLGGATLACVSGRAEAQSSAHTGELHDVSVCELQIEPGKYDGQLIRVRGRVSIAFEDFTLYDRGCAPSSGGAFPTPVWLEYGGDEGSPAIYCCGHHGREPGEVPEVQGRRIPLLRDSQLQEFRDRLTAERKVRPDGLECQVRECYFYDLSATISGHFFARQETSDGAMTGYGHLGGSHLLFIEKVSEVDARRTAVPAGGVFEWKKEAWEVPPEQAKEILQEYDACKSDCEPVERKMLAFGAAHWNASPELLTDWNSTSRGMAETIWSSPNLLETFDFLFPNDKLDNGPLRTNLTVVKAAGAPTSGPLPRSTKVHCEAQDWQAGTPEESARSLQRTVDEGSEPWRLDAQKVAWAAVQSFAQEQKRDLSPILQPEECRWESFEDEGKDFASCSWISRDGMQVVGATLMRYGFLVSTERPKERTVWTPVQAGIGTCKPD